MRSRTDYTITSRQVYSWAEQVLRQVELVKDHGWKCTASLITAIVLRATCRSISISAACQDLLGAPSDQAMMTAVADGLPKTLSVLERRLNEAMTAPIPRQMRRRAWEVAIDFHLDPYYGKPYARRNEIYYGPPKQGTTKFHAYASACIVEYGRRYTLALTWVQRHESKVQVLCRLLGRIRESGLKIRCLLLDREFFNLPVVELLQQEHLPFVIPAKFSGRRPRARRKATGLRWIKQQAAGWYTHTMTSGKQRATISICVGYRHYLNRKDGKKKVQKLLFAAWGVNGSPTSIRERYRKRFGIETSYRQRRQGRIYTTTRCPHLRLFFVALSFIVRNVWVWIHQLRIANGSGNGLTLRLGLLRFKRMLDWITHEVMTLFHDGPTPYIAQPP